MDSAGIGAHRNRRTQKQLSTQIGLATHPIAQATHEDTDATDAAGQEHCTVLSDVLVPLVRAHGAR